MRNILLVLLFLPAISWANIITFDNSGLSGGTVTYDGDGGALIGTGITFNLVTSEGTPSNSGALLDCIGCTMSFTTGTNVFEGPPSYIWNGGGSLTLTGDVYDGANLIASGTLATGTFDGANGLFSNQNLSATFTGLGVDTKNDDLITYFGLVNPFQFAQSQLALTGEGGCIVDGGTSGFTCDVTNADFDNTGNPAGEVPAPATLLLLGLGLLGVGATRRKRA